MTAATSLDVSHLWNRAAFGISAEGAEERAGREWDDLVDELVDADLVPLPRPAALDDPDLGMNMEWLRYAQMVAAWVDHMASSPAPGAEKLAWFWHNHFTTSYDKVMWVEGLWRQLTTWRAGAQGDVRALLGDVVVDSAMCFYLDNVSNVVDDINENFGREFLELFTMGAGKFTENDVVEASRCFTGHNVEWGTTALLPRFYPELHDNGTKTVLGATGNFDGLGLCDVICSGTRKTTFARHLVRRLWNAWVYPNPPNTIVNAVATTFIGDGFTGRALMRAVLRHAAFRSAKTRQQWLRTPLERALAVARTTGFAPSQVNVLDALQRTRHLPYNPPNVSGWPGGRELNTPSAWWELGALMVRATNLAVMQHPAQLPATAGMTHAAAAREALRWAGVLDPQTRTVTDMATHLSRVRATSPSSEQSFLVMAALLAPDFATGGRK